MPSIKRSSVRVMQNAPLAPVSSLSPQIHLADCTEEMQKRLLKTGVFVDGVYVPFADGSSL